jgi:hypothetical protein
LSPLNSRNTPEYMWSNTKHSESGVRYSMQQIFTKSYYIYKWN